MLYHIYICTLLQMHVVCLFPCFLLFYLLMVCNHSLPAMFDDTQKKKLVRPYLYGVGYPRQTSTWGNFIDRAYVKTASLLAELLIDSWLFITLIEESNWCKDLSFFSFPRSFDHGGFCRVNFRVFDTNFCFRPLIVALLDTRRELSRLYGEKLSHLPWLPYLRSCLVPRDNSGTSI